MLWLISREVRLLLKHCKFIKLEKYSIPSRLAIDLDGQLIDVTIATDLTQTNWVSVEADKTYHVATSDYLSKGMDKLTPLTHYTEIWNEGWLIRDLYIEYIKEHKQISAAIDGRSGLIR